MTAAERITRAEARARFEKGETIGYAFTPGAREVEMWITEGVGRQPTFGYLIHHIAQQDDQRAERGQARRLAYWYKPTEYPTIDKQQQEIEHDAIQRLRATLSARSVSDTYMLKRIRTILAELTEQENNQ